MWNSLSLFIIFFSSSAQELVHRLPPGETISFYTRVAPDLSGIGYSKTKTGAFKYAPVFLNFNNGNETSLPNILYDPTFSPDYHLKNSQGFLFGARGGSTSFAKYFSFFLPGQFVAPQKEMYFSNISGYATVSFLDDEKILPPELKPFVGKYIIMGKRWRWFIVDVVKNSQGEARDVVLIYPTTPNLAASPLCPQLSTHFDQADSMLSPRGQFISLKTSRDKVPVIVRTKDCKVMSTPALNGLYGGKASFSHDERFIAFHAFGNDGKKPTADTITNDGLIKALADQGSVANAFIYDLTSDQLTQITFNDDADSGINFFPHFSGDGDWIYYHRHAPNDDSSEIWRVETTETP